MSAAHLRRVRRRAAAARRRPGPPIGGGCDGKARGEEGERARPKNEACESGPITNHKGTQNSDVGESDACVNGNDGGYGTSESGASAGAPSIARRPAVPPVHNRQPRAVPQVAVARERLSVDEQREGGARHQRRGAGEEQGAGGGGCGCGRAGRVVALCRERLRGGRAGGRLRRVPRRGRLLGRRRRRRRGEGDERGRLGHGGGRRRLRVGVASALRHEI